MESSTHKLCAIGEAPARSATALDWFATIATVLTVAIFIIFRVATTGLLGDELLYLHAVDLGVPDSLFAPGSSHPPLFRVVVGLFSSRDSADWIVRLPSCLFAIGTIFIWQRVLLRLVNDKLLRAMILPAMALNPIWLHHTYQCLPYSPLSFFASLHCLTLLRVLEKPTIKNHLAVIASASVLPWLHFYGITVLLAEQFLWLMLWLKKAMSLKRIVYTNLAIAILTLPIVPLAVFYIVHDRDFPLSLITDYPSYFSHASTYFFSVVTFPSVTFQLPLYAVLYFAVMIFLWKSFDTVCSSRQDSSPDDQIIQSYGFTGIVFLISGFTAAQTHSLLAGTAMWPRYMLAGAWIHLPLILFLITFFKFRRFAYVFSVVCVLLSVSSVVTMTTPNPPGADYQEVAHFLRENQQAHDAFLAQSVDFWVQENNFDQLWYERYFNSQMPVVSGVYMKRHKLLKTGMNFSNIDPQVKRIWVYSHLFKEPWLRSQKIESWELVSLQNFGGPFPLALFERSDPNTSVQREVALQRSHGFSRGVEEREHSPD